jgi:hypothetical protein
MTQGYRTSRETLSFAYPRVMTAAYHMLRTGALYEDLGERYFDTRERLKLVRRLVRRLGDRGVQVEVKEAASRVSL